MEEFRGMPYEQISTIVNEIDDNSREIRLLLSVVDCDAPYLVNYDILLRFHLFFDPKQKFAIFLAE